MGLYTTEKKFDIFNHLLDTIHERDERTDWHRPTSSTAFIFIFIYQIYGRQLNRKKTATENIRGHIHIKRKSGDKCLCIASRGKNYPILLPRSTRPAEFHEIRLDEVKSPT